MFNFAPYFFENKKVSILLISKMRKIVLTLSFIVMAIAVMAIPAKPGLWKTIKLANGTQVRVQLRGDEHCHFWQADNGTCYLERNGAYVVADKAKLTKHGQLRRAKAAKAQLNRLKKVAKKGPRKVGGATGNDYTGKKKGIIILVNFKSQSFKEGHDQALYDRIANEVGFTNADGFKGSVHDYFLAQSGGLFDLTFDVVGPVQMENVSSYYGANDEWGNDKRAHEMVIEACKGADKDVNFKDYDWDGDGEVDQVFVLYNGLGEAAGGSSNTVYPHEYALSGYNEIDENGKYIDYRLHLDGVTIDTYACSSEMTISSGSKTVIDGIGTICHEFSHCLGFPDLYDTTYSGFGMGDWDLMDQGSYNGGYDCGMVPAGYSAYERWCAGWLEPIELTEDTEVTAMKALSEGGDAYVIYNEAHPDEYFLLENRQKTGWDAELPGKGLLVIHADYDEEIWSWNIVNSKITKSNYEEYYGVEYGDPDGGPLNDHMRLTVVPADNKLSVYNTSGDTYPKGKLDSITNNSTPKFSLYNANTDGGKLLNRGIYNIKQNSNGTISFNFKANPYSTQGGTPDDPDQPEQPEQPIEGVVFHETFDQCDGTGGNDGKWNGSIASSKDRFKPDNEGWITFREQMFDENISYGAYKCAKFGKTDKSLGLIPGTVMTPEFSLNGEAKLIVKVAPWASGKENGLSIYYANENITTSDELIELYNDYLEENQWNEITLNINGDGANYIILDPQGRLFIDDVIVFVPSDDTSGISNAVPRVRTVGGRIYSIDGRYVGLDFEALPHGIYIIDGKKVVK